MGVFQADGMLSKVIVTIPTRKGIQGQGRSGSLFPGCSQLLSILFFALA